MEGSFSLCFIDLLLVNNSRFLEFKFKCLMVIIWGRFFGSLLKIVLWFCLFLWVVISFSGL